MNKRSVAKAILEGIRVKKEEDDEKDVKPSASPDDIDKVVTDVDDEVNDVEHDDLFGDESDPGGEFAPDANMIIKDDEKQPGEDDELQIDVDVEVEGPEDDESENGEGSDDSTKKDLFQYIVTNKNPSDSQVHSMAKQLGMEPDDLEEVIYSIIGSFSAGKSVSAGLRTENVDPNELKMGIEVETEHSNLPLIAERIAMDHLAEIPDYYTRLKKMEDDAKAEGSVADIPGEEPEDDDEMWPREPTSWPKAEPEDDDEE